MTTAAITPALCQRCAGCCHALVEGEVVACKHLRVVAGGYRCAIYSTRPAVCRDYDCTRSGQPDPAVADRVELAARSLHLEATP